MGGGIVREFGIDMYTLLYLKWTYCIAHGTLFHVMWQPGWEGSLGENGHMCMYGWVPSLFTWNYHNIVYWLYPIWKKKFRKQTSLRKCHVYLKHLICTKMKVYMYTWAMFLFDIVDWCCIGETCFTNAVVHLRGTWFSSWFVFTVIR